MSQCLVVPRASLEKTPFWARFQRTNSKLDSALFLEEIEISELLELINREGIFKERKGEDGVEVKPEWQQVIFYALLIQGNRSFVYKRGGAESGSSEERLHSKLSAGIGGHIEPFDAGLINSLHRELDEELFFYSEDKEIAFPGKVKVVGVIKSDLDEVSTVHLGVVCIVELEDPSITVQLKGDENVEGWFTTKAEYEDLIANGNYVPEGWTDLLIREIASKVVR